MSNIVEIGELRIRRAERMLSRSEEGCTHFNFTYDPNGEIVKCDDCGKQIGAFWALALLVDHYNRAFEKLNSAKAQYAEAKAKDVSLLAAQRVERAWRSRKMVPSCPHCNEAIFPQDGFGGAVVNREIALRRRAVGKPPAA